MWHHPKYYEELRRIRKLHEAGSQDQAPSDKQQAATNCRSDDMTQESGSVKLQASSFKLQAASDSKNFLMSGNP